MMISICMDLALETEELVLPGGCAFVKWLVKGGPDLTDKGSFCLPEMLLYDPKHSIGYAHALFPRAQAGNTRADRDAKPQCALREKGAHGVGVADLMKEAGLTHGGFYAHFDSREALVIEAFAYAMDRSIEHWRKTVEQLPPEKRLSAIVESDLIDCPSRRPRPRLCGSDPGPRDRPGGTEGAARVCGQAGPDD